MVKQYTPAILKAVSDEISAKDVCTVSSVNCRILSTDACVTDVNAYMCIDILLSHAFIHFILHFQLTPKLRNISSTPTAYR